MKHTCTSAAVQVGVECDVFGGSYVWLMPVMGAGVKGAETHKKDAEEVRESVPSHPCSVASARWACGMTQCSQRPTRFISGPGALSHLSCTRAS